MHPVCDKQAWAREKAICRKDSQPFDVQSRFKLGQYKMKSDDESKERASVRRGSSRSLGHEAVEETFLFSRAYFLRKYVKKCRAAI